jgi:DNA-binding response OmpR family regulator
MAEIAVAQDGQGCAELEAGMARLQLLGQPGSGVKGMTILIADDDRLLTRVLSTRLKQAGFETQVVFDAMQAIRIAQHIGPAAVLLNVNMPRSTGLHALRQLKSSIETSKIPIIVINGSLDPKTEETVQRLGAEKCLGRPPDFERLLGMVHRLVGQPPAINENRAKGWMPG